jgi:alcohol dehydrogenase
VSHRAQVLTLDAPGALRWADVQLPAPGPGQVRIQTLLSAVSISSELSVVEGRTDLPLPRKLGYQTLAKVVEGSDLPMGSRVMTTTGHASAAVLAAQDCIPVPDDVPDRVALAAILGEETQKGIRKVAPLPYERVLVAGAGLLGLLTVFNLVQRGVRQLSVLEPDEAQRQLAQDFGATLPDEGTTFDVGFECSASPQGFTDLLARMRPGGRVCVLSDGNWGGLILPPSFHARELSVVASSDGEDYQGYAQWLWQQPTSLLERLFEHTVRPSDLIATFARLRQMPRPVSVVVDWQPSS